jgi:heme a synthase
VALLVGGLLLVQVALGIGNVLLHLPLGVATAHNGVAALLLVSLIYLNYRLWRQQH